MTNKTFATWLNEELAFVGWTQADLARATGLSTGTISNVLSEQRKPGVDFVLAVARALKVTPEDLFRRAGILPPKPAISYGPDIDEILEILKRLPDESRKELIKYARYQYHLIQNEGDDA